MSNCNTAFLSQPVLLGIIAIAKTSNQNDFDEIMSPFSSEEWLSEADHFNASKLPPKNLRLVKEYAWKK